MPIGSLFFFQSPLTPRITLLICNPVIPGGIGFINTA